MSRPLTLEGLTRYLLEGKESTFLAALGARQQAGLSKNSVGR
jgi:hypothetical protein